MIPFDWGLQYDPRGFLFISEMVSGVYVVQMDEDRNAEFVYPPLYTNDEEDQFKSQLRPTKQSTPRN